MRTILPGDAVEDLSVEQDEDAYVASYSGTLPAVVRRRVDYVKSIKAPPAAVLDFGAGFGFIARGLADAGYTVTALEKSPNAVASMRSRGMRVIGNLEELAAERFDIITMWHVLEHISRPLPVLERLSEMLAPGGSLIVAVPNAGGLFARLSFEHWIWTLPWHLHYFTDESLRVLLSRTPLQVRSLSQGTGDVAALECALGELALRRPSRLTIREYAHAGTGRPQSAAYRTAISVLRPISALVQSGARALAMGEELIAHAAAPTHNSR